MEKEKNFFLEGKKGAKAEQRSSGPTWTARPRPGKGTWRLLRLVPPEKPLLPADLPSKKSENSGAASETPAAKSDGPGLDVTTPGDLLRPRWSAELFRRGVAAHLEGREPRRRPAR